jgi:hypothetical protein
VDQNLRSAMRNSTVWVYERFAKELGDARETAYMRKIGMAMRSPLATSHSGLRATSPSHPSSRLLSCNGFTAINCLSRSSTSGL